jgi:hypothetical protein
MVTFPVVMLVGTVIFTAYVAKGATRVRKLEKPEAVVLDAPRKIKPGTHAKNIANREVTCIF